MFGIDMKLSKLIWQHFHFWVNYLFHDRATHCMPKSYCNSLCDSLHCQSKYNLNAWFYCKFHITLINFKAFQWMASGIMTKRFIVLGHSVNSWCKITIQSFVVAWWKSSTISLVSLLSQLPPQKGLWPISIWISLHIYKAGSWIFKDFDLVIFAVWHHPTSYLLPSLFIPSLFLFLSLTAVCLTLPGKLRHVRPCGAAALKTKLSKRLGKESRKVKEDIECGWGLTAMAS